LVETRPRRDVDTSRDRLETETSRPRPHPCKATTVPFSLDCVHHYYHYYYYYCFFFLGDFFKKPKAPSLQIGSG